MRDIDLGLELNSKIILVLQLDGKSIRASLVLAQDLPRFVVKAGEIFITAISKIDDS